MSTIAELASPPARHQAPIALGEFVPLVAALMALGALGVDMMLPALPAIGSDLGVAGANAPQLVVSVYLIGLGVGQLIHGPLCDNRGRRPVMLAALATYFVCNVVAAASQSFAVLLGVRFAAAVAVAATRVVTVATVRDCYAGRPMAKVMSLAAMVFMIAPVLAPTLGGGVLLLGSWRLIFGVIAGATLVVGAWYARRLPETLPPARRVPLSPGRLADGALRTLTDRWSLGYTLASTVLMGALFGYVTSVAQIVGDVFDAGPRLGVVFACTAGAMAAASLLNSQVVLRLGSRVLSQGALAVLAAAALAATLAAAGGRESLLGFVLLQAVMLGCFSLANANFSALAMAEMGDIAGAASSVQGFISITGGALLGSAIGQSYAGTTVPVHLGFLLAALAAFAVVAVVERGRLFRAG